MRISGRFRVSRWATAERVGRAASERQDGADGRPSRSTQQPITGRRIGDAWFVVESMSRHGFSTLAERLAVLDKLTACVRLHGTMCP